MVQSPGDLARIYERQVREVHERDGLRYFGDMADDYELPSLGTGPQDRIWPDFVAEDTVGMGRATGKVDWVEAAVLGTALLAGSTLLDQPAYDWSVKHADSQWMKRTVKLGDALPFAAMGLSAVFAFDESRPRLSDAGTAALEAGVVALAASEALKYGLGRARPTTGEGRGSFEPGTTDDAYQSMPSNHVAVMWAAVTPTRRSSTRRGCMAWRASPISRASAAASTGSRTRWRGRCLATRWGRSPGKRAATRARARTRSSSA
jgi:hypothetical protein